MKNKKGRPRNDDDNTLLAIARKIKANGKMKVRSAIVQCLPEYSDANIRRLQRKWRLEGQHYLNKVSEENKRVVDRTHIGVAPRHYSLIAQEIQASIDRITAPTRHLREAIDRLNAPFRQMQEMQEALRLQMPAIHSAKRLAEALKPSGLELAMEQFKRFELENMMPSSALQVMRMAK